MILDNHSFSDWLSTSHIIFSGNGSHKWKLLTQHDNAIFSDAFYTASDIAVVAAAAFNEQEFSDIAYADPVYLKDFYSYHA